MTRTALGCRIRLLKALGNLNDVAKYVGCRWDFDPPAMDRIVARMMAAAPGLGHLTVVLIRALDDERSALDHVRIAEACADAEWPLPLKEIELNEPCEGTMTLRFHPADLPPHNGAFIRMPMSLGVNDHSLGWFDGTAQSEKEKQGAVKARLAAAQHKLNRAIAVYGKKAEAA